MRHEDGDHAERKSRRGRGRIDRRAARAGLARIPAKRSCPGVRSGRCARSDRLTRLSRGRIPGRCGELGRRGGKHRHSGFRSLEVELSGSAGTVGQERAKRPALNLYIRKGYRGHGPLRQVPSIAGGRRLMKRNAGLSYLTERQESRRGATQREGSSRIIGNGRVAAPRVSRRTLSNRSGEGSQGATGLYCSVLMRTELGTGMSI